MTEVLPLAVWKECESLWKGYPGGVPLQHRRQHSPLKKIVYDQPSCSTPFRYLSGYAWDDKVGQARGHERACGWGARFWCLGNRCHEVAVKAWRLRSMFDVPLMGANSPSRREKFKDRPQSDAFVCAQERGLAMQQRKGRYLVSF